MKSKVIKGKKEVEDRKFRIKTWSDSIKKLLVVSKAIARHSTNFRRTMNKNQREKSSSGCCLPKIY